MLSLGIALFGLGLFVLGLDPNLPHGVALGLVFSAPFFFVAAYITWTSKE